MWLSRSRERWLGTARVGAVVAATGAALSIAQAAQAKDLAVGAMAPPFELQSSDGRRVTLAEFAGKQGVVLAWFPKAFTPG
jgi:peroxiredoxin Q/BCP